MDTLVDSEWSINSSSLGSIEVTDPWCAEPSRNCSQTQPTFKPVLIYHTVFGTKTSMISIGKKITFQKAQDVIHSGQLPDKRAWFFPHHSTPLAELCLTPCVWMQLWWLQANKNTSSGRRVIVLLHWQPHN